MKDYVYIHKCLGLRCHTKHFVKEFKNVFAQIKSMFFRVKNHSTCVKKEQYLTTNFMKKKDENILESKEFIKIAICFKGVLVSSFTFTN